MQEDQNEKFSNEIKKQLISRVEDMLKTGPTIEDEFRFLIVGNEDSQKPLLSRLLRVEKIVWPPNALSILYNTLNYKAKIDYKEHQFQLYFLSNLEKLKENFELFNEACVHSDAIAIFYNPNDQEDFNHAAEIGKFLRSKFSDIEILLTAGSENYSTPLLELERLEKEYQINNYDDYETLISEILINVLKRKKKVDRKKKFLKNELKKIMDQLDDQKIIDDVDHFVQSMHGEKPVTAEKVLPEVSQIPPKDNLIFISYSHADKDPWLNRLQVYLKPLEREGIIQRWDDTLIEPGQNWFNEIKRAIASAKVGIFLVSADFLASDFISEEELPDLLNAAEERGVSILSVILDPCRFTKTKGLAVLQAINDPSKPLVNLTKGEQGAVFQKVANQVEKLLSKQ